MLKANTSRGQDNTPCVGLFAVSKQGRDSGRAYVVIGDVDNDFVLVADGKYRKLASPKKKRKKHLKFGPVIDSIKGKITTGNKVFDSEIYSAIDNISKLVEPINMSIIDAKA